MRARMRTALEDPQIIYGASECGIEWTLTSFNTCIMPPHLRERAEFTGFNRNSDTDGFLIFISEP